MVKAAFSFGPVATGDVTTITAIVTVIPIPFGLCPSHLPQKTDSFRGIPKLVVRHWLLHIVPDRPESGKL